MSGAVLWLLFTVVYFERRAIANWCAEVIAEGIRRSSDDD